MRKIITAIALATIAGTAQAGKVAVDMDFENTLPTYFNLPTYQEDSFTLTSDTPDSTLIDINNIVRTNLGIFGGGTNSQSIFWGANGQNSTLSLAHDGGLRFDVLSLDASSLYNASGTLTLSGTKIGGGTVSDTIVVDGNISTYSVSNMIDIVDMTISYDGGVFSAPFDLDNISMNVIPIPAAVWLFGSGLVGLIGWSRRKAITS